MTKDSGAVPCDCKVKVIIRRRRRSIWRWEGNCDGGNIMRGGRRKRVTNLVECKLRAEVRAGLRASKSSSKYVKRFYDACRVVKVM